MLAILVPGVTAGALCPVCGSTVGHLEWQTWQTNGIQHSGWILCCDNCDYTTCRDINGNIPDPVIAQRAWQGKMFPWIYNGWTHEQILVR